MRLGGPRLRILDDGGIEIVDPGYDCLPLIDEFDPEYRIRTDSLPGFEVPRLTHLRAYRTALEHEALGGMTLSDLWAAHDRAMAFWRTGAPCASEGVDLLSLKAVIARRLLSDCILCPRRCGVDRTSGQPGLCGLKAEAFAAEWFVHIAEEPMINPSLVVNLRGCAMRCKGCQQHRLLDTRGGEVERLTPAVWNDLDFAGARSLSMVGGNPDEFLAAILEFLRAAPPDWALPLVWNNSAYMSPEVVRLLAGVVDAYVPDVKFHTEACARAYTRVLGYPDTARTAISALLNDGVPVLARILVMPGHAECCHLPTLSWLATQNVQRLYVSIRGQYSPDWRITRRDDALAARAGADEVARVIAAARCVGLRVVEAEGC